MICEALQLLVGNASRRILSDPLAEVESIRESCAAMNSGRDVFSEIRKRGFEFSPARCSLVDAIGNDSYSWLVVAAGITNIPDQSNGLGSGNDV